MKKLILPALLLMSSLVVHAGELAKVYIGEGPSLNLAHSPSLLTLKHPGHGKVGMYYQVKHNGKLEHMIHVGKEELLPLAISAMLYQRFILTIQERTKRLGAIHYDDTLFIGQKFYEEYQLSEAKDLLQKLTDCSDLVRYLSLESNIVYRTEEIEAIRPLICES